MLIVVDVETKMTRSINVTNFLSKNIYKELKNGFSDELAQSACTKIMETVVSKSNYVMRDNDKLYSVDLVNMHIKEISIEMLLPTQKTDFGVKVFAAVIENLKKCITDFYFMVEPNTIIQFPSFYVNEIGVVTLSSRTELDNKVISKIVSEYFSGDNAENLKKELIEYSLKENEVILTCMNTEGTHYIASDKKGKFTVEKLERLYNSKRIRDIVKPHLMGFNEHADKICKRIYNYIVHKFTDRIDDAIIIHSTEEYLLIEFDFEGQKVPAIIYRDNEKYWYVTKPLPFTVEKIFELLKGHTFDVLRNEYRITKIKKIIGELSEYDEWRLSEFEDFAFFHYTKRNKYDKFEEYNMKLNNDIEIREITWNGDTISAWDKFMKRFREKFKDEKQEFYVYLVKIHE